MPPGPIFSPIAIAPFNIGLITSANTTRHRRGLRKRCSVAKDPNIGVVAARTRNGRKQQSRAASAGYPEVFGGHGGGAKSGAAKAYAPRATV